MWSTVATTDLEAALRTLGRVVLRWFLHWLKFLRALVTLSLGGVVGLCAGFVLLQSDKGMLAALPLPVRQFVGGFLQGYGTRGFTLTASDLTTIRSVALGGLLSGVVLAGYGLITLCNWFLDRR